MLRELGPRFTGSPAQEELIDHVTGQFADLGLNVRQDVHEFTRWDVPPGDDNLSLIVGADAVEVSSAFPYSGTTGPHGVRGRLRRLRGPVPLWALARN
ncbi:MAG: hypothetical protein WCI74_04680 [Actinomycetes bacterium]